jgi:meso-butanediol dehydrogenase/(S,S)-butanediol dehydrogenase/diacetyl reductase
MCLKEKPMGLLDGKTAIVTGGGTGIGLAIARRFHGEGAKVVICGRRMEKLLESSQRISSRGEGVYAVKADVTVEDDLKRIVEETVKFTGRIDILVNNAGIILSFGKMEEVDPSLWDTVLKTNARAPWRLMVAVLPEMRKVGGGSIINMSSLAGIKAFPGHGIYGTSKAALIEVSQVMAMELASDQIRVNVIVPAHVEGTELHIATVGKENIKKRSELMAPLHPLGRNGKPEDIANAALFLASDQSSWLTGIVVNADGGRSLETNRTPSVFSVSKIPS